jgi:lysophospholipase L1-like esterase
MKHLTALVLALLAASACDLNTSTGPSDSDPGTTTGNAVSYTVIGASDAIGYGSSVTCVPFMACPDGRGYVQLIADRLKADGKTVSFLNLGLPGGVLGPETQAIGNQIGKEILTNFLDSEMPFVAKDATLVTVFAGGNDANTIGSALEAGLGGSNPAAYQAARVAQFSADLKTLMTGIKSRAPAARIVVLNLPNLAALPYTSSYSLARKRALQSIAVALSAQINALRTSQGALVVDLMCDGAFYQPGAYSSDGFHPNDAGYAHLADVVYGPASTGVASAPAASCPQMTLY